MTIDPSEVSTDDRFAAELRGFGIVGIAAILVILSGNFLLAPLSAILVLVWAQASNTPWRALGFVRPRSWVVEAALGILLGVALKLVMKAVILPLLGAPPVNQAYHYLAHNDREILLFAVYSVVIGAGFGEETVFRGWMFERFGRLLGSSSTVKAQIVVLTAAIFGAVHYPDQGLAGAEQATLVGLVFGAIYAIRPQLWPLMCAHAAFDLAALAIIYYDIESEVAYFVFS